MGTSREESIKRLKALSEKCTKVEGLQTEEATKMSLIVPFFVALGYDVYDNDEFRAEYIADVGTKKGEKVDYAILDSGQPQIIIECKQVGTNLNGKVDQLFRYFTATTAKIGILTDGIKYLFFTDSQKVNIMDSEPFMEIDMLNLNNSDIEKILMYHKDNLDISRISDNVKYEQFEQFCDVTVKDMLENRTDSDLLKFLLEQADVQTDDMAKVAKIFNLSLIKGINKKYKVKQEKEIKTKEEDKEFEGRQLKNEVEEIDLNKEYVIGEVNVYGHVLDYAIILGDKIDKASYPGVAVELLNKIYDMDSSLIDMLVEDTDFETPKYDKISRRADRCAISRKIDRDDVYIEVKLTGQEMLKFTMKVMEKCNIDRNNILLKFIK